jgi:hypothetical protein
MSRPASAEGMAWPWIAVGTVKPILSQASQSEGCKPYNKNINAYNYFLLTSFANVLKSSSFTPSTPSMVIFELQGYGKIIPLVNIEK